MKISLLVPEVNLRPTASLSLLQEVHFAPPRHPVHKPFKDHGVKQVQAHRYKCLSCERTFRHIPQRGDGQKSPDGIKNGIGLTQWLYSGEDEHDLAEELAA